MRFGRRHAIHGFVWVAVLIQLGFAIAFLVDAAETNSTYDALASHRIAVRGHSVGCVTVVTGRNLIGRRLCRVDYR